jgi:hypothetical protein
LVADGGTYELAAHLGAETVERTVAAHSSFAGRFRTKTIRAP